MEADKYYEAQIAEQRSFTIYPEQIRRLREYAEEEDKTMSFVVRRAIDSHLSIQSSEEVDDEIRSDSTEGRA